MNLSAFIFGKFKLGLLIIREFNPEQLKLDKKMLMLRWKRLVSGWQAVNRNQKARSRGRICWQCVRHNENPVYLGL